MLSFLDDINGKSLSESEVNNLMSENIKNLEERGEKLNRLNNLAEDLNNGAETFRDLVKQHKSELKKKATRWGGIL